MNLDEAGIIDPTKGVLIPLENAVSVAGTLLLTEATLTDVRQHKDEREELPMEVGQWGTRNRATACR